MAVSTFPSFAGIGKETTPGTAVVATAFPPATSIASEDVKNYAADNAMRGSAVDSYNQVPTQGWGTFAFDGPVYMDTIGYMLKGLFGAEDLSGAGPYTHKFSVLNSGTYQPPTYTLVDYNGFEARAFPFGVFSQVELSYGADALLTHSTQATTFPSSVVSKPSQSFSAKTAVAAYKTTVTVGGSGTQLVESATLTMARTVNPIPALNGSASPASIFAAQVAFSGSATILYTDDTFLTPMLSGTPQAVDFAIANGADTLTVHGTSALFTGAPISRGNNGWMEITVAFTGVGNTTDVTTAGGGYSPAAVTLVNTTSTAY